MNFLKQIFTDESTAYVGLCKFKMVKATAASGVHNVKFSTSPKNFFVTDFSKNVLL